MPETEAEDIVSRLEALRKRAPEEKPAEQKPPVPEKKKKIARAVGILVIVIAVVAVAFVGYNFVYKPILEKKTAEIELQRATQEALLKAKTEKLKEINNAFVGLPLKYATEKPALIDGLNKATTQSQVNAIDVTTPANDGWRAYKLDQVEELRPAENVKITVDGKIYRGYSVVLDTINKLPYTQLKTATIEKFFRHYFPIRLTREQAGGWATTGNYVNIWLKEGTNVTLLAKDAEIIAIMRGRESGTIDLTERESKAEAGGGTEGTGTMTTITLTPTSSGGWGTLTGSFTGSAGGKRMETETTFSVDIIEIQKVIAAGKVSEADLDESLQNYGYRLDEIESAMGIGDLEAEYLLLFEVSEEEVPNLVVKASPTSDEREDIFVTISKSSTLSK